MARKALPVRIRFPAQKRTYTYTPGRCTSLTPSENWPTISFMRRTIFANDEIYHVFNRGIERRPTFTSKREYDRAILTLGFYRFQNPPLRLSKALLLKSEDKESFFLKLKKESKVLVEIISYCLMPNHFHFLIRQRSENGLAKFLSNFTNSYTRYFDTKHKRIGPLFQGTFRAVHIETEEQLTHVSRYIHLNPVSSFVIKEEELYSYPWSSLPEFLGEEKEEICNKEIILSYFSSKEKYRRFIHDQIDYAKKLETIKHLLLE